MDEGGPIGGLLQSGAKTFARGGRPTGEQNLRGMAGKSRVSAGERFEDHGDEGRAGSIDQSKLVNGAGAAIRLWLPLHTWRRGATKDIDGRDLCNQSGMITPLGWLQFGVGADQRDKATLPTETLVTIATRMPHALSTTARWLA